MVGRVYGNFNCPMGNLPISIEGTPKWFNGLCKNFPGMVSGRMEGRKKKGGSRFEREEDDKEDEGVGYLYRGPDYSVHCLQPLFYVQ